MRRQEIFSILATSARRRPEGKPKAARAYKTDVAKRTSAAFVDLLIGMIIGLPFILGGTWYVGALLAGLYLLVRDGLPIKALSYQSVGKRLMALHVERDRTGKRRLDPVTSALRNIPLAAGPILAAFVGFVSIELALVVGVVPLIVEFVSILRDPNGLRIGDKMAGTKVLD